MGLPSPMGSHLVDHSLGEALRPWSRASVAAAQSLPACCGRPSALQPSLPMASTRRGLPPSWKLLSTSGLCVWLPPGTSPLSHCPPRERLTGSLGLVCQSPSWPTRPQRVPSHTHCLVMDLSSASSAPRLLSGSLPGEGVCLGLASLVPLWALTLHTWVWAAQCFFAGTGAGGWLQL